MGRESRRKWEEQSRASHNQDVLYEKIKNGKFPVPSRHLISSPHIP